MTWKIKNKMVSIVWNVDKSTYATNDTFQKPDDETRTETELVADFHGVNFKKNCDYTRFLRHTKLSRVILNREQRHKMVTVIKEGVVPVVLQTEQKFVFWWRKAIDVRIIFRHEDCDKPSSVRYLMILINIFLCQMVWDLRGGQKDLTNCSLRYSLQFPKAQRAK